jgi:hypothetical protein
VAALTGLPDFGLPVPPGAVRVLFPYGSGPFTVLPDRLEVPAGPDGVPELALTLVRGTVPWLPPDPYGVLDLRLAPDYQLDEALELALGLRPDAAVTPFTVSGGFLRLLPTAAEVDVPEALTRPVALAFDGLDRGRFTVTLPMDAAVFAEGLLSGGVVAVRAHAELEFPGVAPRLAASVGFNPGILLPALAGLGEGGVVARDDLLSLLATGLPGLPLELQAERGLDPAELAGTLVDWLRARYATLAPAPVPGPAAFLRLPAEAPAGHVTWDLSQALATWRPLVLDQDPLAGVRSFVAANGTSALVARSAVPPMPTGQLSVTVTANLPAVRLGVLELGVELVAPPRPPVRPQQSSAVARLDPPADRASLRLRLSPVEPPEYTCQAYAVVAGGGNEPLRGPAVPRRGDTVALGAADLPVTFVPVRADPAVLALATVHVRLQFLDPGLPAQDADLDPKRPAVAFTRPVPALGSPAPAPGSLTVDCRPLDGAAPVRLGPRDAAPLVITLASLPGSRPQEVSVSAVFPGSDELVAVDLLAEGRPEETAWISTLALTPDRPQRTWRYAASSPFHAGYRWRPYRSAPPSAPWSPVLPAGTPLVVEPEPRPPAPPVIPEPPTEPIPT